MYRSYEGFLSRVINQGTMHSPTHLCTCEWQVFKSTLLKKPAYPWNKDTVPVIVHRNWYNPDIISPPPLLKSICLHCGLPLPYLNIWHYNYVSERSKWPSFDTCYAFWKPAIREIRTLPTFICTCTYTKKLRVYSCSSLGPRVTN